jgi:hypothetical protein
MTIKYRYNEGDLLRQITDYVNSTYDEHYSQNKFQATEFIIDGGHGEGFTIGNILKYAQRYGHKGTPTDWRKDLMKVIHYAIIAMYVHDKEYTEEDADEDDRYRLNTVTFSETGFGGTVTLNTEHVAFPDWGKNNMGNSSLLTSLDIPGIIDLSGDKTKKTKKKKD